MDDPELRQRQKLARLITGYLNHSLTEAQHRELDEWIGRDDANMELFERLTDEKNKTRAADWFTTLDRETVSGEAAISGRPRRRYRRMIEYSAVAAVVLLLAGPIVFRELSRRSADDELARETPVSPAYFGRSILRDASGQETILSKHKGQSVSISPQLQVPFSANELDYSQMRTESGENELRTAAGALIRVRLSDGSRVVLNAGSELHYPVSFDGNTRTVRLAGEAFLEVTPDKKRPFIVKCGGKEITVLGTSFDVAQSSDSSKMVVTVKEGSIRITGLARGVIVNAGERARISDTCAIGRFANSQEADGWTRGHFVFNSEPLNSVMESVCRWYGMTVHFNEPMEHKITGTINRSMKLQEVLDLLRRSTNVRFQVKDQTIIVQP